MTTESIIEQLEIFGLKTIEAKIYLYLLNNQPKTILELGRELNIPRTSVYDNALKLSDKGLIEKIVTYKSQKLKAYPIQILQSFIDQEKTKVETLQKTFETLEKSLLPTVLHTNNTEVRYYNGVQGFQQMMWNSLAAEKETIAYAQFGKIEIVGASFFEWHCQMMIEKKIQDRVITNPRKEILTFLKNDSMREYRKVFEETRVLDQNRLYISGDTTIYNNVFAVCYWKQGEIVGVEIENEELVKTQKSIFEEMWQLAEPLEKYVEME